ncbi:MAG: type II toxin-antitoxin system VapC family toxin [Candidatus Aenigmarchaeota archaeon]|nr:type II toxin-antitoxin system VapC family toxin [Candidatus Aenigmarchaeota archaeon]
MNPSITQGVSNDKRIKEHIDANVFLETITDDSEFVAQCTRILGKFTSSNPIYIGVFSTPSLGEITQNIIFKLGGARAMAFEFLYKLCKDRGVKIFTPTLKTYEIIEELRLLNGYLKSMDTLILACAIADRARIFVTLDTDFIGNERFIAEVKEKYGLLIKNASKV